MRQTNNLPYIPPLGNYFEDYYFDKLIRTIVIEGVIYLVLKDFLQFFRLDFDMVLGLIPDHEIQYVTVSKETLSVPQPQLYYKTPQYNPKFYQELKKSSVNNKILHTSMGNLSPLFHPLSDFFLGTIACRYEYLKSLIPVNSLQLKLWDKWYREGVLLKLRQNIKANKLQKDSLVSYKSKNCKLLEYNPRVTKDRYYEKRGIKQSNGFNLSFHELLLNQAEQKVKLQKNLGELTVYEINSHHTNSLDFGTLNYPLELSQPFQHE